MRINLFAPKLIGWYRHQHRDLPWRHTRDPYFIWLSEVILQQTRVVQGLPYYLQFTEAYPTVFDLAAAPEQAVIRLWQGLGYYSRARNLHQTAQFIVNEMNGKFPTTYHKLLKLKGIGPYTAAAIASFAYDEAVAVVDGNVYRVLARIFGIATDITSTEGKKQFAELANELLDTAQPATYNQAIMEFGALQCAPISPDCLLCPFQADCVANATGQISKLPVKIKKTKVRERFFNYFVIIKNQKIALKQRTDRDIWQQLYDFCLVETPEKATSLDDLELSQALQNLLNTGKITAPARSYSHILTHQRIEAQFWQIELTTNDQSTLPENLQWYSPAEAEELPKPVLIASYWAQMQMDFP